ncbi:MAG: hypothetical protein HFACDABA_00859 [Anaerolineales bacterium]|nr:hypothetical protein [Anaerolineales bacterium]
MSAFPAWWPDPASSEKTEAGMWASLQTLLDVKGSKPKQGEGIDSKEMKDGSGRHFMLRNSRKHTYARLSPEEFWIWQRMDGEQTVQGIVMAYFMEFKAFAFAAVVGLVERLRESHMLSEAPRHLYADVSRALQEQSLAHKLTWLARVVFTKEWSIKGLDSHLERIHRYGGWILFTLPVQIFFLLVSVVGGFFFLRFAQDPQYHLFGESLGEGAIQLGLLAYIPLVIHEFGHAIAAKHVGCQVYKGGAMLYYGLPAAFVDTTDVWMHGKKARLTVTWAGPYTGFIIGGLTALIVYLWKDINVVTATFLLQIGMIGMFTSAMNVLPLLKLDGYYLLADALEIPRLRERSLEFLFKNLRTKFTKREKWTREEWIFLFFGILAFLSTVYFTYGGIRFWDSKTTSSISTLLAFSGNLLQLALNIGTVLLAVSSIAFSLYFLASKGAGVVTWLRKIGLLSTRWRAALILILGAVVVIEFPPLLLPTLAPWFTLAFGLASFGYAAWLAIRNFRAMRGSVHAGMWVTSALGFLAGGLSFIGGVNAGWTGATVPLYEAGLVLSVLTFAFTGRLIFGLRGSWRAASIALLALGLVVWCVSLFTPVESVHAWTGLLLLGGMLHWNMRPAIHQADAQKKIQVQSTRQQMVETFHEIQSSILSDLENDFGKRTREWVEGGTYRDNARRVDESHLSSTMTGMTPADYGASMALSLEDMLSGVGRAAGKNYAVRALARGYDGLDWEAQELAEETLLKYVRYAASLNTNLADTRTEVESILRSVPLFLKLSDGEISALGKKFKSTHFRRGETVIRAGASGGTFYLVRAGRVSLEESDSAQQPKPILLARGDYFGEAALLSGGPHPVTARAETPLDVLILKQQDFNHHLRCVFEGQGGRRVVSARLGILRRVPLFSELESLELMELEKKLEEVNFRAGETIFEHGERGHHFYIIESGRVSVQIPVQKEGGNVDEAERAKLGSGEYFGEAALLMDTPRTATVVAIKPTKLLRLDSRKFDELISESKGMKQAMERVSSRRVLSNERWLRENAMAG